MIAQAPEPIDRSPSRRRVYWIPVGLLVAVGHFVTLIGCRQIGTPTRSVTQVSPAESPKPKRKGDLPEFVKTSSKVSTNAGSPSTDTPSNTPQAASEENGLTAGHPVQNPVSSPVPPANDGSSTDVVQTSSQRVFETDSEGSFITILSFSNETEQPRLAQAPNDQVDYSSSLPTTSSDRPKSLRLTFPSEIPGATSPTISLPVTDVDHPERKLAAINTLFPPASVPRNLQIPDDRVMTLEELEELAMMNSPIIAQSLAAITMNQGTAIQAGVYPNPVFGYEADTVGSSFTRNYQGTYLAQTIKTAGKLPLARAAANMDLMNSQLAYERTRQQILHDVRTGYFSVLVSQEAIRINEALVRFTNQVYAIMIERLKNGEQAGYELAQLRTLVKQAQTILVNSQNHYISAWKQLAVATGTPELPLARVEGRVDMPVPNLDYDVLLERVLSVHPDLQASRNLEAQARLQLRLQRAIPIPDPTVAGAFQNDSTVPGFQRTSYNLNVSVPLPLFDRNQGNIRNALGKLEMNSRQYAVTTNALTSQLADAFERYQNGRFQSEYYRTQILPDLARAYRGVYDRHISNSDKVAFGDIIVAQQNLAGGVSNYITSLWTQWNAAVDLANLMQLNDFRSLFTDLPPVPDLPATPSPVDATTEGDQP